MTFPCPNCQFVASTSKGLTNHRRLCDRLRRMTKTDSNPPTSAQASSTITATTATPSQCNQQSEAPSSHPGFHPDSDCNEPPAKKRRSPRFHPGNKNPPCKHIKCPFCSELDVGHGLAFHHHLLSCKNVDPKISAILSSAHDPTMI